MTCYRDREYCPFHEDCQDGSTCPVAYNDEVKAGALAWMGENAAVALCIDKPECFKEKK